MRKRTELLHLEASIDERDRDELRALRDRVLELASTTPTLALDTNALWDRGEIDQSLALSTALIVRTLEKVRHSAYVSRDRYLFSTHEGRRSHTTHLGRVATANEQIDRTLLEDTDWAALRFIHDLISSDTPADRIRRDFRWSQAPSLPVSEARKAQIDAFDQIKDALRGSMALRRLFNAAARHEPQRSGRT